MASNNVSATWMKTTDMTIKTATATITANVDNAIESKIDIGNM